MRRLAAACLFIDDLLNKYHSFLVHIMRKDEQLFVVVSVEGDESLFFILKSSDFKRICLELLRDGDGFVVGDLFVEFLDLTELHGYRAFYLDLIIRVMHLLHVYLLESLAIDLLAGKLLWEGGERGIE